MTEDSWKEYELWNSLLTTYFFKGRYKGKPVYLEVNDQLLSQIGLDAGIESKNYPDQFKRAIKNTLFQKNLFQKHWTNCYQWKSRQQLDDAPPFIALLSFFSYVAEKMVMDEKYHANNYYGRMLRELGLPDHHSQALQLSFRQFSSRFWQNLNNWLEAWDGEIGIPTARALDSRFYVSIAISQALVRESDRNILRKLFDDKGLTPGQKLTKEQMLSLLYIWATNSAHINTSLSKLIRGKEDIRDKVVEIACSELEAWNGHIEKKVSANERSTKAFYYANIRTQPNKISLNLGANLSKEDCGKYSLDATSTTEARIAFEDVSDEIELHWLSDYNIATLEPGYQIAHGDAMLGSFQLSAKDTKTKIYRVGSPLCVFGFRRDEGAYFEVQRVSLGQESLLMVHDSIKDEVDKLLPSIARPGFQSFSPSQMRGLPSNWMVYQNVQIVNVDPECGLDALVPLATSAIELTGGVFLGQNTWLTSHPPELIVTVDSLQKIQLQLYEISSESSDEKSTTIELPGGVNIIKLSDFCVNDAQYQIRVNLISNPELILLSTYFRLGSSNNVRQLRTSADLAYTLNPYKSLGALSATRTNLVGGALRGMYFDSSIDTDYNCLELFQDNNDSALSRIDEEALEQQVNLTTKTLTSNSCILKGQHVIKYLPKPPDAPRGFLTMGFCRGCGLAKWKTATSGDGNTFQIVKIQKEQQDKAKTTINARNIAPILIRHRDEVDLNIKTIFDSLCYVLQGNFERFNGIVASCVNEENWYSKELLRKLCSLGHLDVEYEIATMQPKSWKMSEPTLVSVDSSRAYLTGWRSQKFIARMKEVANQLGAKINQFNDHGVPVVELLGVSQDDLPTFVKIVSQETTFPLTATKNLNETLLTVLPTIQELLNELTLLDLPTADLEYFSTEFGKWEVAHDSNRVGAYRYKKYGMRYFYVSKDTIQLKKAYVCDARLVKYYAVADCFDKYYVYSREQKILSVPIGMELPAIYERVLTASSCLLPKKSDGRLLYQNIEENIAEGLAFKLFYE